MSLFASTSPSYLLLQSLDALNAILDGNFRQTLMLLCDEVGTLRQALTAHGYSLIGDESTKLTIAPKSYGYTGEELSELLAEQGIVCEFADRDFLVMMMSTAHSPEEFLQLKDALLAVERRAPMEDNALAPSRAKRVMSIRDAAFSPKEKRPVDECLGCVMASMSVSCPPAVPVAVCGEVIDEQTIACMKYYGITECEVVVCGARPTPHLRTF